MTLIASRYSKPEQSWDAWSNMAAIGSLVFCTDCGNLLYGSSGDDKAILACDVCEAVNKGLAWFCMGKT